MASLIKKIIRGRPYYYARRCARVNGKPKIVWQKYLGSADSIVAKIEAANNPARPVEVLVREFGASAALFDLAQRLRIARHIDRHVPKRGAGPSVGTYLLAATLNRCLAPCSKAALGDWFRSTVLDRLLAVQARQLSSQRFWDNMQRVPVEAIPAIERDIVAAMVAEFQVDPRRVLFDATNFFTFLDSFNDRSTLAQRGHSKEGRAALRIVGLALLVTVDGQLPLLHCTFPGNQPDAPTFASLCTALAARVREIAAGAEHVTLVFDKGNNSRENMDLVAASPFHFIGSLVPTQHPDLLAVPDHKFHPLSGPGLAGVRAYRTVKKVFGVSRTVLVTFNDVLFAKQAQTLMREVSKRQRRLRELHAQLGRWHAGQVKGGQPPTLKGVTKKVNGWLQSRHMRELFEVDLSAGDDGLPRLEYRFDMAAWKCLEDTLLGKTLLFTDNEDWSDAEIVLGYRAQHHVEGAFRQLKDPHRIALRPQYHWTDQKIQVHVFTCVLALMLCGLLQRELRRQGHKHSLPALLDLLAGMREIAMVYPKTDGRAKERVEFETSKLSEEQRALYEVLDLQRYAER